MTPLTLADVWQRSLELFFGGMKLIVQGALCFVAIGAIHIRFIGVCAADCVQAAREYVDDWRPVRTP